MPLPQDYNNPCLHWTSFPFFRSAFSWPTCPTTGMTAWARTPLWTWPTSCRAGPTCDCRLCPQHSWPTSTSSCSLSKGTLSGRWHWTFCPWWEGGESQFISAERVQGTLLEVWKRVFHKCLSSSGFILFSDVLVCFMDSVYFLFAFRSFHLLVQKVGTPQWGCLVVGVFWELVILTGK